MKRFITNTISLKILLGVLEVVNHDVRRIRGGELTPFLDTERRSMNLYRLYYYLIIDRESIQNNISITLQ